MASSVKIVSKLLRAQTRMSRNLPAADVVVSSHENVEYGWTQHHSNRHIILGDHVTEPESLDLIAELYKVTTSRLGSGSREVNGSGERIRLGPKCEVLHVLRDSPSGPLLPQIQTLGEHQPLRISRIALFLALQTAIRYLSIHSCARLPVTHYCRYQHAETRVDFPGHQQPLHWSTGEVQEARESVSQTSRRNRQDGPRPRARS